MKLKKYTPNPDYLDEPCVRCGVDIEPHENRYMGEKDCEPHCETCAREVMPGERKISYSDTDGDHITPSITELMAEMEGDINQVSDDEFINWFDMVHGNGEIWDVEVVL